MPTRDVVIEAGFDGILERTLRAGVEVNLGLENLEAGANLSNLLVGQHERVISAKARPNSRTSSGVL